MAVLKIYQENDSSNCESFENLDEINQALSSVNIQVAQWQANKEFSKEAKQEEVLEAFSEQVEKIVEEHNFKGVDVINVNDSIPAEKQKELREKFLAEHTHSDDEVRYFIEGQGLFCIHEQGKVFQILCTAGDFISVPAMTKHWFDMGENANFKCIRFFGEESGWIADYTGDEIAEDFPKLDCFVASLLAMTDS